MFVEILKCASRTFHEMLAPFPPQSLINNSLPRFQFEENVSGIYAFAMVRHPVTRFISAYGTIMDRIGGKSLPCMREKLKLILLMKEPARFNAFVDLYIK